MLFDYMQYATTFRKAACNGEARGSAYLSDRSHFGVSSLWIAGQHTAQDLRQETVQYRCG